MTTYIIEGTEMGIRNIDDNFEVTEPFNMKLEFTKLNYTENLYKIDTNDFDKSYFVSIFMSPKL